MRGLRPLCSHLSDLLFGDACGAFRGGDRELGEFILRSGRCLFCGLCSQVCPVDAITMSHEYELSVMDRDGLIYTKTELAAIGAQLPNWWEDGTGVCRSSGCLGRHPRR